MNQLQTNPLRETKKSFKEIPLSSLLFHLALARHSPCGCSEQVSKSQRSLKYYTSKKNFKKGVLGAQKVMKCPKSFKGPWELQELELGNLTLNQVILYKGIQFPGMDVVFYVCPYTLPVLSTSSKPAIPILNKPPPPTLENPMSFRRKCVLEELVSTICHGYPIDANGAPKFESSTHWMSVKVTSI